VRSARHHSWSSLVSNWRRSPVAKADASRREPSVALRALHPVRASVADASDPRPAAGRNLEQLVSRGPKQARVGCHPELAQAVGQDLHHRVVEEALAPGDGLEAPSPQDADTAAGAADPDEPLLVFVEGHHEVVGQAVAGREGGETPPLEAAQPGLRADPEGSLPVFEQHVDHRVREAFGLAEVLEPATGEAVQAGAVGPDPDRALPVFEDRETPDAVSLPAHAGTSSAPPGARLRRPAVALPSQTLPPRSSSSASTPVSDCPRNGGSAVKRSRSSKPTLSFVASQRFPPRLAAMATIKPSGNAGTGEGAGARPGSKDAVLDGSEAAARGPEPQRPVAGRGESVDDPAAHGRRVLRVEDGEADAVETHEALFRGEPEVAVGGLRDAEHRALREPLLGLPAVHRVLGQTPGRVERGRGCRQQHERGHEQGR